MQIKNDTVRLRILKPGDYVVASYAGPDDAILSAEGKIERITEDYLVIKSMSGKHTCKFGLWQLMSLVCMDRDISFIREGDAYTDLERLSLMLQ